MSEAITLVEESTLINHELGREGLSPSELQTLADRVRALQEAKAKFEADPAQQKLLAEVSEDFERGLGDFMVNRNVETILATYKGGEAARRAAAEASLGNNAARIAKDTTNAYRSEAVVNNSSRKRSDRKRKRSDRNRKRKHSRTTRR